MTVYPCPDPWSAALAPMFAAAGFVLLFAFLAFLIKWAQTGFDPDYGNEYHDADCECGECDLPSGRMVEAANESLADRVLAWRKANGVDDG